MSVLSRREFIKALVTGASALLVPFHKIAQRDLLLSDYPGYCAFWHRRNRYVKIPNYVHFQDVFDRAERDDFIVLVPPEHSLWNGNITEIVID